jgi:hypothetical protein
MPLDPQLSPNFRGIGRVRFLASKDSVRSEIEKGWSLKAVHEQLRDKLKISYAQFTRYVLRYLGSFDLASQRWIPPSSSSARPLKPAPPERFAP